VIGPRKPLFIYNPPSRYPVYRYKYLPSNHQFYEAYAHE
jgi:hypothetical protein